MSYVVTAASGSLGSLIVEALLERGAAPDSVVATARTVSRLSGFADRGVRTAALDYSDPSTVSAVIKPGDVLILVSGSEIGKRIKQHSDVITAAKDAGVARIVYTSAPHATTSALVLAPEHKGTEEFLVASGIPFTILRNNWYNENYLVQLGTARERGSFIASVGDGRVASASRRDYAEAAAAAALDDAFAGDVIELSGDTSFTFDDLAATISDVIGSPVEFTNLTPEEQTAALTSAGLDAGTVGFIVALDGNIRDGLLSETNGNLSRIIGRPTTPLRDTLASA